MTIVADAQKQVVDDMLRGHSLFKNCSESFFALIEGQGLLKSCDKGKIFFFQGDVAERFYLVRDGWVKLFRETMEGTQAVIDILSTGYIFGEDALFQDKTHGYSAEMADCGHVFSAPISALRKELDENSRFALDMLEFVSQRQSGKVREIESLSIQNAPQRIGCFFMRLVPKNQYHEPVRLHLPYDKTLIAARLGMQPETFSRALKKLCDTTGVRVKGAVVEIDDVQDIASYSCMACSSKFPCKNIEKYQ